MMRWWWILAVACLSSPAEAKTKVDPKTVPGTAKWLCDRFEHAFVEARQASCSPKARNGSDVQAFKQEAKHKYQQCLEMINSAVGQKRQKYASSAAKQCADAAKAYAKNANAESRGQVLTQCSGVITGQRAKGDACESALDCGQGLVCLGSKGAPPGTCSVPLGEGDSCDFDYSGASSLIALLQEKKQPCAEGLACSTELGKPRVCAKEAAASTQFFKAAGAACHEHGECKGLCKDGKCAAVCGSG